MIDQAIAGDLDIAAALDKRRAAAPKRARVFGVEPRVLIDQKAAPRATVIEVNGRDRPGFLHLVSRTLNACDVRVRLAKIATFGEHAIDVFYVKNRYGHKVDDAHARSIRRTVTEALRADDRALGFADAPDSRRPAA